jgi:diacylglycerol O-acyltransferase / wax synthase
MTALAHSPLSHVDAAWLRMDSPTNRMVISSALSLEGRLSYDEVLTLVEQRLLAKHERFRLRVVESRIPLAAPHWEPDPHFDVRCHVHHVRLPEPGGDRELTDLVSDLMSARLDPTRPLWQLFVVDDALGGTALVSRLHHCLADGVALMRVLLGLCDEPTNRSEPPRVGQLRVSPKDDVKSLSGRAASYAATMGRLLLLPSDPHTPLRGRLSVRKRALRVPQLPCAALKAAARTRGGTLNDLLGACVAGALRTGLERAGQDLCGLTVRALVPVFLRDRDDTGLGNHFGLVFLPLPVGLDDAEARFTAVKRSMDAIKGDDDATVAFAVLDAMGVASEELEHIGLEVFSRKASLLTSNVPGPSEERHLCGHRLTDISVWAPVSGSMGMGITAVSYAGQLRVTLHVDASLPVDAELLARALAEEAARFL